MSLREFKKHISDGGIFYSGGHIDRCITMESSCINLYVTVLNWTDGSIKS